MSDEEFSPIIKRPKSDNTSDLDISPLLSQDSFNESTKSKIFNDPIHGSIELHGLLVKLIDTPQFQRLRRLKQVGVSSYVYPSASHHRFEHSIGTCYLAGELVNHLRQRQPTLNITDKDVLCVQMAGLCHDLGHGPYSHMFEEVVAELRPDLHWKHERASIEMFDYMIEVNSLMPYFEQAGLDQNDLIFVKELIYGQLNEENSTNSIWPYKGRDINKSFLYEIVSNKLTGIDVDKFDYFARDSYYLGTNISFEHMRFIKFYRVIQVDDGKRHLCLRDKEVRTCYEIYRIRDDLHRRAYQHPVVKGIEVMVKEALIAANEYLHFTNASGKSDIRLVETIDDMFTFSQIDDHITTLIRYSTHPQMEKVKQIIDQIEHRNIYRYIGNTNVSSTANFNKKSCKTACQEIVDCCQFDEGTAMITARDLIIQVVELTCGDRGEDPIRNMWFYTKEHPDQATRIMKEQVSTLLPQNFREFDIRLYCKTRDEHICSIVRCAFKQFCQIKGYTTPKGSDHWILRPKHEHLFASSLSITDLKKAATM